MKRKSRREWIRSSLRLLFGDLEEEKTSEAAAPEPLGGFFEGFGVLLKGRKHEGLE
jgi:hypothetical protein